MFRGIVFVLVNPSTRMHSLLVTLFAILYEIPADPTETRSLLIGTLSLQSQCCLQSFPETIMWSLLMWLVHAVLSCSTNYDTTRTLETGQTKRQHARDRGAVLQHTNDGQTTATDTYRQRFGSCVHTRMVKCACTLEARVLNDGLHIDNMNKHDL